MSERQRSPIYDCLEHSPSDWRSSAKGGWPCSAAKIAIWPTLGRRSGKPWHIRAEFPESLPQARPRPRSRKGTNTASRLADYFWPVSRTQTRVCTRARTGHRPMGSVFGKNTPEDFSHPNDQYIDTFIGWTILGVYLPFSIFWNLGTDPSIRNPNPVWQLMEVRSESASNNSTSFFIFSAVIINLTSFQMSSKISPASLADNWETKTRLSANSSRDAEEQEPP